MGDRSFTEKLLMALLVNALNTESSTHAYVREQLLRIGFTEEEVEEYFG